MKYYTKEWYSLLEKQFYTSGLKKIPDKIYTNKEIRDFYNRELKKEIDIDRRIYDTPSTFGYHDKLLKPDTFNPGNFLFKNEETGELFHPENVEMAKEFFDKYRREKEAEFANRPPFDPTETIECFETGYRMGVRHAASHYPEWVCKTVDKHLLALHLMPESAYKRLKQEERDNRRAINKIEKAAKRVLDKQDIPREIQSVFLFHDAYILALKKAGADVEMHLHKDKLCIGEETPYIKVIFKKVNMLDREKGLVFRTKIGDDGEKYSNCQFLHHELYRTKGGYEVHMLLWTWKALRYLTIGCEDICFENNLKL